MKNSNIYFLLLFISFWTSCEQESIENVESESAVLEAFIYAGQPLDSIRITQSFSYGQVDTNIIVLDDLNVMISDDTESFLLTPMGDGFYQNLAVEIQPDQNYRLEFMWQDETVIADTYVPGKREATISAETVELDKIEEGSFGGFGEMPDPIEITWDNPEGGYYYVVVKNLEEDPEYVNENIAVLEEENSGRQPFQFISEPQITDFYAINPRRELIQFGTHQIIVFRVNAEYAALYESSGSSTLSLEQPPTNVTNGLGIFTGVSSDTLYLEVEEQ